MLPLVVEVEKEKLCFWPGWIPETSYRRGKPCRILDGKFLGKMLVRVKMIDKEVILMELRSDQEIKEVIRGAIDLPSSMFVAMDRWIEVIRRSSLSLLDQVFWTASKLGQKGFFFFLFGDFLGKTIEVDRRKSSKEILTHGRVKVLLGRVCKLLSEVPFLVGKFLSLSWLEKTWDPYGEKFLPSLPSLGPHPRHWC